jgi:hypothetical protein
MEKGQTRYCSPIKQFHPQWMKLPINTRLVFPKNSSTLQAWIFHLTIF